MGYPRSMYTGTSFLTWGNSYACYGAVVAIVTNYHHPQRDGTELDARKTLTMALAQLAADCLE